MAGYADISWYCYIEVADERIYDPGQMNQLAPPPMLSILHFKIVTITKGIIHNFGISSGSLPGAIVPLL